MLVVYSKAADDTIGIETLVGEFTESGTNHGKKVFQRTKVPPGVEDIPVFMYYWDGRDGEDFQGWWFGESVGGTQVWSKCNSSDALPPRSGWRIPWDGPVQADLIVERRKLPAVEAKVEKQEELVDTSPGTEAEAQERLQRAEDRVQIAEAEAEQALESARVMLEGDVTQEHLSAVDDLLQAQLQVLNEANKGLAADIMDSRKTAPKAVMRLTKLAPRVRSVQASLAQEIKHAKQLAGKKKQDVEDSKKRAIAEEKLMQAEQRDSKSLEDALPEAMEVAAKAEELLDTVLAAASPLMSDAAEEANEITAAAIRETEATSVKAQLGLKEARHHINQKIVAAKTYAPEARKVALNEYSTLQDKLNEIQKKMTPYTRIRKEFEQRLLSRKVMAEATRRMGEAELEADRVVCPLGAKTSEDELTSAESSISPAMTTLTAALAWVQEKLKAAPSFLKQDLAQVLSRGADTKKKLADFQQKLRSRMEGLQLQVALREAAAKAKAVEDALAAVAEAETPFVRGADLLPLDEATEALAASKAAGQAADEKIAEAKAFLKAKILVIKCYPDSSQEPATEELSAVMARVEAAAQQLAVFSKETSARETANLVHEVTRKVVDAEAKVQRTIEAAEPLLEDQTEVEVERIKVATQLTLEAEKAAALACADSRKVLAAKLKDGRTQELSSLASELTKLQARLTVAVQELARQRKVALQGERLWKAKTLIQEQSEDFGRVEEAVEQAEILTTPLGDERPSEDKLEEMVGAVDGVQAKVTASMTALAAVQSAVQGSAKSQLDGLLERVRVAQRRVDEMKETTKEQREGMTCEVALREAQGKLEAVDAALGRASEAEAPYLKGLEQLPLDVTAQAVEGSLAAIATIQAAIDEAHAFLQQKAAEIRGLSDVVSKHGLKELESLGKKREAASEQLALFTKETTERQRAMHQQRALAKVAEAELAAHKMTSTAQEFTFKENEKGDVEISLDFAKEMCSRFGSVSKQAEESFEAAKQYLMERQRATHSEKKDQATVQEAAKLVSRLNQVQLDLQKAKAMASEHEQKFVARMVMQEASELVQKVSKDLEHVTEEAVPLLVEGGRRFVVASMIKMITEALAEHASLQNLTLEDVFAMADVAKEGEVSEGAFMEFLERVPNLCSRTDLTFSQAQRKAVFAQMDKDGDGLVTQSDFLASFRDRFICVHQISVTDGYDINGSKSVDKLEVEEVVETLAEPVTNEVSGMTRVEVRKVQDGTTGWVTMQGNQGKLYLQLYTIYTAYSKALDKTLLAAKKDTSKAIEYINAKATELARCEKGPLAEAKAELTKLRPQASVLLAKLEQLKKKVDEARTGHNRREEFERKKVEDKKDRKAAAVVLKAIREKVEAAEAGLAALQAAAAPLTAEDISSVADPISVCEATDKAAAETELPIAAARSCLTAHEGKLAKATKGPWFEAKKDMKKLNQRMTESAKKVSDIVQAAKQGASALAEAKIGQVAAALRQSVHAADGTTEELFGRLSDSEDKISEAALCRHLDSLPGVTLSEQHKRLLYFGQEAGGLSRKAFFDMVERYFKCVKEIAITTTFDIKGGNTLRKLEVGELVEVVEGPRSDAALGVMRIKARALADGRIGWLTSTGNHGTPFLQEVPRPCLFPTAALPLQDAFGGDSREVRPVQAHEVLELLEGPRKEEVGAALRARCKAMSDGAVGWITAKSKHGVEHVQPGKSTYTCLSSIALTDCADIKNCKVVRKLSKGEKLTVLEGPVQDEQTSVPRIRAAAASDGAEGWVTVRGNAGSVYAEETGRQMVVCRATPLQSAFESDTGENLRVLAEEEVLEILAEPEEEETVAPVRARVRAVSDRKVGWVEVQDAKLLPWSSRYRCIAATPMTDGLAVETATKVRQLEVGEEVEALQGPKLEASLDVLRLRARATKDGAVGWVTVAGNAGKLFLKCLKQK